MSLYFFFVFINRPKLIHFFLSDQVPFPQKVLQEHLVIVKFVQLLPDAVIVNIALFMNKGKIYNFGFKLFIDSFHDKLASLLQK